MLELANFIDSDTVRAIEYSFLEDSLKKDWQLSDDFRLVERRNKEIGLVLQETEEMTWRAAS